ncbi:glycoside hydrolase family 9 protein [Herbaspirillum sp. SJZ107]|uniref:glycoside hydrolase family 9 protein n=1 Tax=Herbaspirillum sp. SJZ107 TaxID=2572881 RepID=UPI00114EC934|nr:glycoside hydrolase family 9 protein [Herbaspirillum sp. SJZ107]TQK11778.1 endoglucanase [Herbaspirillum sp. SJZ107]
MTRPAAIHRPTLRTLAAALLLVGSSAGTMAATPPAIKINQLGFLPASQKLAVVQAGSAARFAILDAASGRTVFEGDLGAPATWDASGENVRLADFSALRTPGTYRLQVAGLPDSAPFPVGADAYRELDAGAIRAYTLNRASIALTPAVAGAYARAAGHPDTRVEIHPSAASSKRPAGTIISSPKGWYDAGDYNKYIVNSGISTYTLLAAYEHFPGWFDKLAVRLPESGNGLPDLLNEALWNLEWMATMQDPEDGGVYHKLTNKAFDGMVMPDQATGPRYVVQKNTAATLDFAATMAAASRVLAPFDSQQPGRSARYLAAAEAAWAWAKAHPALLYKQPADVSTGDYGDKSVDDEFAWAAAELLATTGKDVYRAQALAGGGNPAQTEPGWADVRMLGWVTLARPHARVAAADAAAVRQPLLANADRLVARWQASPYRVSMVRKDFVWGSNAVVLNQAMMLVAAYRAEPRPAYLQAAQSALDYVLGRNGPGISFVTGFGTTSTMHPHHRPSVADGIAAPVPGWLAGGPNPGQQDKKGCQAPYPSSLPALSYLDDACSYASNEVAINWNAPLVYVAAALQSLVK